MSELGRKRLREALKRYLAGERMRSEAENAADEWEAGYLSVMRAISKYGREKAISAPSLSDALRELNSIIRNPMLDEFTRGFLTAWIDALRFTIGGDRVNSSRESRKATK